VLLVIDLQRYYLDPKGSFRRYPESREPRAFEYIESRCRDVVIPNVRRLLSHFREKRWPVVYLRLCGQRADRSDLHYTFRSSHLRAEKLGFPGIYPLANETLAEVVPELAPCPGEIVLDKVTFSGFTSSDLEAVLAQLSAGILVFSGLATSQCVDTTARDAADRGYRVIQVEDAQADYTERSHWAALYASHGTCGGNIVTAREVIEADHPRDLIEDLDF